MSGKVNAVVVGVTAAAAAWAARHALTQGDHPLLRAYVVITTIVTSAILVGEILLLLRPALLERVGERAQLAAVVALLLVGVAAPASMRIVGRHRLGPERMILDSALQTEIAAGMLVEGRNPYRERYHGTPLETWHRNAWVNDAPSLYHYVYPPFSLLVTVPVRGASLALAGWYDQRFLLLPCFFSAFFLAWRGLRGDGWRPTVLCAVFLNPWLTPSIVQGRLESLMLLLMMLFLEALNRGRFGIAGGLLGLLGMTKTTLIPLFPFAFLYVACVRGWSWRSGGLHGWIRESRACWVPCFLVVLILLTPFLTWDAGAYWEDTWRCLSGEGDHPYPISESGFFGIGSLVLYLKLADGPLDSFPFWMIQIPACLAIAAFGFRLVHESPSADRMMGAFVATALAYLYFSRFSDATYVASLASYPVLASRLRLTTRPV